MATIQKYEKLSSQERQNRYFSALVFLWHYLKSFFCTIKNMYFSSYINTINKIKIRNQNFYLFKMQTINYGGNFAQRVNKRY